MQIALTKINELRVPQHTDVKVPTATPEMLNKRSIALAELRALGGLQDIIPDPTAWQKEIRIERSLFEHD